MNIENTIVWAVCMILWGILLAADKPMLAIIFSVMGIIVICTSRK